MTDMGPKEQPQVTDQSMLPPDPISDLGEKIGQIPQTPMTRRHFNGLLAKSLGGAIFLPFVNKRGVVPPVTPSVPTVPPGETATPTPEKPAIKEMVLLDGSAVVDFPFDPNTAWELAENFATGEKVEVIGTDTAEDGLQYHEVKTKEGKIGWVLQSENEIPVEGQTAIEVARSGRTATIISPDNPFVFKAANEEEQRRLPFLQLVEGEQDFTYLIRGKGPTDLTIYNSTESQKIKVSPNDDGTVTVRVEGASQQPNDKPITLPADGTGGFNVALQVTRGETDDTLTIEPWRAGASTGDNTGNPGTIPIRGTFKGTVQWANVTSTNAELTITDMQLTRGAMSTGVTRENLIPEHRRGGSIYELTGQKIGVAESNSYYDDLFVGVHHGFQFINVGWMRPENRFFAGTKVYRGTEEEQFTFKRLSALGLAADFPIYITKRRPDFTTEDLLKDHQEVVTLLTEELPDVPIGIRMFDDMGTLDSVDMRIFPLYPDAAGKLPTNNVRAAANAIAFYNNLNDDPVYRDPITKESSLRPVDINISGDITGAAVQNIISNLDKIRAAQPDIYIGAINISPNNLTEREIENFVTQVHRRGFRVRFSGVGHVKSDGSPPSNTEASLQRLCDRIGVPIDIMSTEGQGDTILKSETGQVRYNAANPDGTPVEDSPYGQYMALLRGL